MGKRGQSRKSATGQELGADSSSLPVLCFLYHLLPQHRKECQTLAMSIAGALIQMPPTCCVLWAGSLTSLSLSFPLCTTENKFSVTRRNLCRLCHVLG